MNYWLHRISHHAETSYPLLDQGYLSIGFSGFHTNEDVNTLFYKEWSHMDELFQRDWGRIPRTRYNLWRFIRDMKAGDKVLVPSWGTFSVYEVLEDAAIPVKDVLLPSLKTWSDEQLYKNEQGLFCREEDTVDLGFLRKVRLIESNIPRKEYADAALTSRMKTRNTNACISDLIENVDNALKAFKENKPISLYSKVIDKHKESLLKLLIEQLNPDKFESLVKWYFQKQGATNVYIPAKNEAGKEGDADIIATFEALKTSYYIQAKHHKNTTSSWAAQQIAEYVDKKESMDDEYTKIPWVISTCNTFSTDCINKAKESKITLINGLDFAQMLLDVGINNIDSAF